MILKISIMTKKGSVCLICGKHILSSEKNRHHVLPRYLKSKHNLWVYLHKDCHDNLNKNGIW